MAREDPQLKIRLPEELKDSIEKSAVKAGRTINAEVVVRLQDSLSGAQSSDGNTTVQTLALALAKAEEKAAVAALEAESRLFRGALVATMLIQLMSELSEEGVAVAQSKEDLDEAYAGALKMVRDANKSASSGHLDTLVADVQKAEKRLADANAARYAEGKPPNKFVLVSDGSYLKHAMSVVSRQTPEPLTRLPVDPAPKGPRPSANARKRLPKT